MTEPLRDPVGRVALTYDDGPHPTLTPQLLDILDTYDAPATFFVLGSCAAEHPEAVRREIDRGDAIGNHTWGHLKLESLTDDGIRVEVEKTQAVLEDLGATVVLFRPPYNSHDPDDDVILRAEGLTPTIWSYRADARDWEDPSGQGKPADEVCSFVVKHARSGDMVLLHDRLVGSVEATPCIIEGLRRRGLEPGRVGPAPGPSAQNDGSWARVIP